MAIVRTLGAAPLAALMAAERIDLGRAGARIRQRPRRPPILPSALRPRRREREGAPHCDRNDPSLRASAAASRVWHSQTTNADQPSARSALSEAASRARLRPIFVRQ